MWNPPGPGIEPVSPVLAGRFLSPGRSLSQTYFDLWLVESKDAEPKNSESWLYHTLYYKRVEHSLILVSEGGPGTNFSWTEGPVYFRKSSELRLSLSSLQGSCLKSIKSKRKWKGRRIPFNKSRDWFRCPFFPVLSVAMVSLTPMVREVGLGTISPGSSVFSKSELILFCPSGFPSCSQSPIQLRFLSAL